MLQSNAYYVNYRKTLSGELQLGHDFINWVSRPYFVIFSKLIEPDGHRLWNIQSSREYNHRALSVPTVYLMLSLENFWGFSVDEVGAWSVLPVAEIDEFICVSEIIGWLIEIDDC